MPCAIASISTSGMPSLRLVSTTRSHSRVAGVELLTGKMAQEFHSSSSPRFRIRCSSQGRCGPSPAIRHRKSRAAYLQFVAGVQQKGVVFHRMQPADRQHRQALWLRICVAGGNSVAGKKSTPIRWTKIFSASTSA